MSPTHSFVLVLTTWLTITASGFAQEPASSQEKKTAQATKAEPTPAELLLDRAIHNLQQADWLSLRFKGRVHVPGVRYLASGSLALAAKVHKVDYRLQVQLADGIGKSRIVCDGETIWIVKRLPRVEAQVSRYSLSALRNARSQLSGQGIPKERVEQVLLDVDAEHGFQAVLPLLRDVRKRMRIDKLEQITEGESAVTVVTGQWTQDSRRAIIRGIFGRQGFIPRKDDWPRLEESWEKRQDFLFIPRTCRIVLGQDDLVPRLVQWSGPTTIGGELVPLVTLSFSEWHIGMPPADAERSRWFVVSEEEKKAAEELDIAGVIRSIRNRLLQQGQINQPSGNSPR